MASARFLSTTDYKATLTDATRVKVTHPFLEFSGKEYVVVSQYMRVGHLYLQCVDDAERRIVTVPASFTDYDPHSAIGKYAPCRGTHFTIKALAEADGILSRASRVSTN